MTKIGFIGLGNMGLPMAQNLMNAGHDVVGYDAFSGARDAAAAAGVAVAESNAKVVRDAEVVVLMLPNGGIVKSVVGEILPEIRSGVCLIDCSTIDVASARDIHHRAAGENVLSLDAPVSGGITGAAAGTLTFMVGGSEEAFAKGAPLFEIMGQKAVLCGDGGAGQAAKICNNMLLSISMIGACETFRLGEKLGLDPAKLFDVVSTSSGYCWSVNKYCPVPGVGPASPADNDYTPGFAAALMVKDTALAQEAAASVGVTTPLGTHAAQLYKAMADAGQGGVDFSGMIKFLDEA